MTNITPQNKIKKTIMLSIDTLENEKMETNEEIEQLWDRNEELVADAKEEFRQSGMETDLRCEWSGIYESKAVAGEMYDGTWVAWTYWYGGGKHGDPASIDWMENAYSVTVTATKQIVTVYKFKKV